MKAFQKGNHDKDLSLLKEFIKESRENEKYNDKLSDLIDQIGMIYIRTRQNPDEVIEFLQKAKNDPRFSEDNIDEWISAIREWQLNGTLTKEVFNPDELFKNAKKYYNLGFKYNKYPRDDTGNAFFHISVSYLLKFIMNLDNDKRIGEVLYMMGHIRSLSWPNDDLWATNFYLKEVVKRFPHTLLAIKAWEKLNDET